MPMIDLKPRLNEPAIRALISFSIGNPTPEKLDQICQRYRRDPYWKIMGFEQNGVVLGCIGMEVVDNSQCFIRCLSVMPCARRQGIGRSMLMYMAQITGVTHLTAETDNEAMGFYSKCGFQVESLGELYPGVERFECVKIL